MIYISLVLNHCNGISGSSQYSLKVTYFVIYKMCLFCLEYTEALSVAIKETGLNVNADKTE
jgi:hypothetical protein